MRILREMIQNRKNRLISACILLLFLIVLFLLCFIPWYSWYKRVIDTEYISIIIDNNEKAFLFVRGSIFRLEKVSYDEEITESIGEDDSYKEFEGFPTINFIEEGRCLEIQETLEAALGQALLDEQIGEFVSTYMAEYRILTDVEREESIQSDSAGILKDYMESRTVKDDVSGKVGR